MNEGMQRKRRYLLCIHDMTFFASCCFLLSLLVVSSSLDRPSRHPCLAGMRCRVPRGPICAKTSSGRSWENNVLRERRLSDEHLAYLYPTLRTYRRCWHLIVTDEGCYWCQRASMGPPAAYGHCTHRAEPLGLHI